MSRAELWVGVLVLLLLSGCASVTPPMAEAHRKDPAPASPTVQPPARPAPAPQPASKKRQKPPAPPAPQAREAPPRPPPLQPIGMDEGRLRALLGAPSTSRDEAPGRQLSFRRSACVLNLTLYPDVETRVFRTLSYEVTSDDHDVQSTALCHARFGLVPDGDPVNAADKQPDQRRAAAVGPGG